MHAIRHLIAQRHLAAVICVATLLLKLLVPTGYMVESDKGRLAIAICSGTVPRTMTMAMPGRPGNMPDHGEPKDHGKAEMPCAFLGLSAAVLAAVDAIQLAALIVFILAVGLSGQAPPPIFPRTYLRPPLRGPPIRL